MKYFFAVMLSLSLGISCKQKELSGQQLDNRLIATMQDYLNKTAKPGATYVVKDVTYFIDKTKKEYNCEFHVNMRVANIDTTGIMAANIPNDFSKVIRKQ
jgi:hypothetical protein